MSTETEDSLANLVNRQIAKIAELTEQRDKLLEIVKEVYEDFESGYIAQESHRANQHRKKLEDRLRTVIAKAEER